ncbi:MAG: trypsin-like peptidase domain-containing protein [Chloroflexota bacterium]
MYCVRCGQALPPDSSFCVYCGASTSLPERPVTLPQPAYPTTLRLPQPRKSRGRTAAIAVALVFSSILFVGMVAVSLYSAMGGFWEVGAPAPTNQGGPPVTVTLPTPSLLPSLGSEIEAVAKAKRSVVLVETEDGSGYGVVLTEDGYILTNQHVVEGGGDVAVYLNDGQPVDAAVVRSAEVPDLALLKAEVSGLVPAAWADSEGVSLGQTVIAIGYSLGFEGEPTVSRGIVSAVRPYDGVNYIQTDAAINPGNSGGPLVDLSGAVIGINSMRIEWTGLRAVQRMNFAIGGNEARYWLENE